MIEKRDSRYRNMMSKENGTADARMEAPIEKYNYGQVPE
jgi:hypothetical protein